MKNIEIEIQVKIENIKPLLNFLKKNGEFKSEEKQIDEYFTPIHRNFLAIKPVKEWLGARDSNKINLAKQIRAIFKAGGAKCIRQLAELHERRAPTYA